MDKGKQTYKLPEGWIEVKLEDISKQITDGSHNPPKGVDDGIPMLSAKNIENNNITFEDVRYISKDDFVYENQRTKIEKGDVLLTIVATIGRTAVVSENVKFTLQRSVAAIKPLIHSKYLMYCFQSPLFQKQLSENAKGTAQKGVYLKTLRSLNVPLAPFHEQYRIVSKIESLFSELDEAEKGLYKAKKQLEVYRQVLLKSAFEGKITELWRKENKVEHAEKPLKQIIQERQNRYLTELDDWEKAIEDWKRNGMTDRKPSRVPKLKKFETVTNKHVSEYGRLPKEWIWTRFGNVSYKIGDIDHKMPKEVKDGIPYLSTGNINSDGTLNFSNPKNISFEDYKRLSSKIKPEFDDIIFPRYGTIGRNVIVKTDKIFLISYSCAIIKTIPDFINAKYLYYFSISPIIKKEIDKYIVQTTQANVGISSIEKFVFPLCSISEQTEIVKLLEIQFSIIEKLEEMIEISKNKSKVLRQSILDKAFSGKLVPQDSLDKPASELLKQIKAEKETFLNKQIDSKKNAPKKIKKMSKALSIEEVLKHSTEPMSAKEVWQKSKHKDNIEDFYAELKELGDKVNEVKKGLDSLLSLQQ